MSDLSDDSDDWDDYSSSESESEESMTIDKVVNASPPGITGLALAEHYFGPMLSPVAATPAQWKAYTENRLATNAKRGNILDRRKRSTCFFVGAIEKELGLDTGTLQKCISILWRSIEMDDVEPRKAETLVRIYSPSVPKYIDVHINYYSRCRYYQVEWFYSIGYKIYNRVSSNYSHQEPSMDGGPPTWHAREGWQSICWGYFDDENGNYGPKWRRIEVAGMGLHEEGVLDVYEALFGPIETPSDEDAEAVLAYRRKLVATCRLLLAVLGIDYKVACTDEEQDRWPDDYTLEGLSDKWVARGIRMACGFELSGDAEAEKRGKEERKKAAMRCDYEVEVDSDEDEDEGEDEDEYW